MTFRLAWVTSRAAAGLDDDEPLALAALADLGVQVDVRAWDDGTVAWPSYDRVVVRSTWDYVDRRTEFVGWLDRVDAGGRLRNPRDMMRWSLDKHYLADLAAAGVAVAPTEYCEPGDPVKFPPGEFVIKPAVGAGSRDAGAYSGAEHDLAQRHVRALHAQDRSVLVQPLLNSVVEDGEWPLVFFGGRYSHAANKRVKLPRGSVVTEFFAPEINAEYEADDDQLAVARAAVDYVIDRFGVPAYARVDLVRDGQGSPCVLEVELVEPSLFLPQADAGAARRLAEALIR